MTTSSNIFVFGSNAAGRHGAGAALAARKRFGALYGQGNGLQGQSYAIPTKDSNLKTLTTNQIRFYVEQFLAFAEKHPEKSFYVTRIGTGLAGKRDEEIAPLFKNASSNCVFDIKWKKFLGEGYNYFTTLL